MSTPPSHPPPLANTTKLTLHPSFNFALAFFVAPAFTNIVWKTYIVFGVFCFVMTFHIFFMYPETQGKTLEEVDVVFDSDVPPWRSAGVRVDFDERVRSVGRREDEGETFGTVLDEDAKEKEKEKDDVEYREGV